MRALFLERAQEVRAGNRGNRTESRRRQATASQRKAAQQDNPLSHGESCSIEEAIALEMAGQHGSRRYYQVLLQPNRAALVEEIAKEKGIRATELIRRMTYDWLERELPASQYKQALAEDQAVWAQAVRNRVEGRAKSKKESEEQAA